MVSEEKEKEKEKEKKKKKMKKIVMMVLVCGVVAWSCHGDSLQNFCKADLKGPDGPAGYHCVPAETVTDEDFKYSFNGKPGIEVLNNAVLFPASVMEAPMFNGRGISAGRVLLRRGGSLPVHSHGASEVLYVTQGEMNVTILATRRAYVNYLKVGDFLIIPKCLLHYLENVGRGEAVAFAAFSSANPRFRFQHLEMYANNVPSPTLSRVTFLDVDQIRRNKARFNGTG